MLDHIPHPLQFLLRKPLPTFDGASVALEKKKRPIYLLVHTTAHHSNLPNTVPFHFSRSSPEEPILPYSKIVFGNGYRGDGGDSWCCKNSQGKYEDAKEGYGLIDSLTGKILEGHFSTKRIIEKLVFEKTANGNFLIENEYELDRLVVYIMSDCQVLQWGRK